MLNESSTPIRDESIDSEGAVPPNFVILGFQDDRTIIPQYMGNVLSKEEWECIKSVTDLYYKNLPKEELEEELDKLILPFVDQPEAVADTEPQYEALHFLPEETTPETYGFFYIGKIIGLTPTPIIKIGTSSTRMGRISHHQRRYKEGWRTIGVWRHTNPTVFEATVARRIHGKELSTGRDFFYLSDDELTDIVSFVKRECGKAV